MARYIWTGSISFGPDPTGQLLRCEGVAGTGEAASVAAGGGVAAAWLRDA